MECVNLVDTSLDLNLNPMRGVDEAQNKEVQSSFIELGRKTSVKEETSALVEELNRVTAENKKLTEMLTVLCENYNALRGQLLEYVSKNPGMDCRKRKAECTANNKNRSNEGNSESSSSDEDSCKRPKEEHVKAKVSRVYVRTEASDTTSLVVKDGYQWRKYGQKVTRDNPCPRAYFKCSFAPSCPVKKKVQRRAEDQSVLVATYEGEHNHPNPSRAEATSSSNNHYMTLTPVPSSASGGQTITLDLTKPAAKPNGEPKSTSVRAIPPPEFHQFLVEQMASSLTKDPTFKAALAAAISGRFIHHNQTDQKW